MKFGTLIKSVLALATLWAASGTAMALTCSYLNGIKPADGFMPLQVSAITVGRDVPVGTEVYRQTFKVASGQAPIVECRDAPFKLWRESFVEPYFGRDSWSSTKYPNVYKTDIDGLGVAFYNSVEALPSASSPRDSVCTSGFRCLINLDVLTNFELILIKTGDVAPGVLQGVNLPTVGMYMNFRSTNTVKLLAYSMGITGSIQIVSRTCSTPHVLVPMGTHQTKAFTGINSASDWKDFSITLNNCPAFNGTYNTNAPGWISQSGDFPTGTGTSGSRTNNRLQYRIDPALAASNVNNGVLNLDPGVAGGPPSASGVGVQIAIRNPGSLSVVPVPLGVYRSSGLNLRTSEGSYSIPLRARYLQTQSNVTPGPANASATFTISYQ